MSQHGEVGLEKHQLEENVRVSKFWGDAIKRGTFAGSDAMAVAGMIGFFDNQYKQSLAEYEAAMVKHPEWGRPKDLEPALAGRPS